jgi:hypothetical protein
VHNELPQRLREKYTDDLLATRRRIDLLETEKDETRKLLKGAVDEEWARERTLRDLLEGKISEQAALPGIEEVGERDRKLGGVLRRAAEAVERICNVDTEPTTGAGDVLEEARDVADRKGAGRGRRS